MKKQLLNHYVLTAITLLYVNVSFATPTAPVRSMEVSHTHVVPTLDGIADDAYGESQTTVLMYDAQAANWTGESDFTAVFQVCYDLDNLYLLSIITDDVEEGYDWSYSSPWMFDNVEVFLQLDTNTTYTEYDSLTVQLRFCRGLDSVQEHGRAARSDFGYYMEAQSGTGWITETAIPWTCAMSESMVPEDITDYLCVIGFDFHGADSDNTDGDPAIGNRDYQTAWDQDEPDGQEDQAWQNVTVFGYIFIGVCDPWRVSVHSENSIKAFPNPSANTLIFDIEGLQTVEIYSINGIKVLAGQTTGLVDISSLKSGLYVARIGNESIRFVKE